MAGGALDAAAVLGDEGLDCRRVQRPRKLLLAALDALSGQMGVAQPVSEPSTQSLDQVLMATDRELPLAALAALQKLGLFNQTSTHSGW